MTLLFPFFHLVRINCIKYFFAKHLKKDIISTITDLLFYQAVSDQIYPWYQGYTCHIFLYRKKVSSGFFLHFLDSCQIIWIFNMWLICNRGNIDKNTWFCFVLYLYQSLWPIRTIQCFFNSFPFILWHPFFIFLLIFSLYIILVLWTW